MNTCLGKSFSFGLLCVSFAGVCQILCVSFFHFGIEGRMWVVIVFISDHCLSIYLNFTFVSPSADSRRAVVSYWRK